MNLVDYTDPVLHEPCRAFDFDTDDAPSLADRLQHEKLRLRGYGLAAPQIGEPVKAFAFLDEIAFNPIILDYGSDGEGNDYELATEGCLSYPGLWVTIKRPVLVKAQYFTDTGEMIERWLDRLESRVYQHELDHLGGFTMIDHASPLKIRRAIEQANKHGFRYEYAELIKHRQEF